MRCLNVNILESFDALIVIQTCEIVDHHLKAVRAVEDLDVEDGLGCRLEQASAADDFHPVDHIRYGFITPAAECPVPCVLVEADDLLLCTAVCKGLYQALRNLLCPADKGIIVF